jgi:hypothetical protein
MTISKLRSEWAYISGRMAALASRPLMLVALNKWGGNDVAATVAVVFLVVMLAAAVSAFDTHRGFYQAFFGDERSRELKPSYRLYCGATTLQIALVSPLLVAFVLYRFADPALAALVAVYFASDRLADEAQRFLIFRGHRQEWGGRMMVKTVLQLGGAAAAAMLLGQHAAHAAVAVLLAGNAVAYGTKLPWRYLPRRWDELKGAAATCLNQRLFWLLSMVTTFISYLDRIVVMLFQQSDMAAYTILVSSMSIVQNAVDYFFMSLRRRDILRGQLSLAGIFLNRHFYLILSAAALVGCIVSWLMLRLYHGRQIDHLELVPIVLLSQVALSVTLVLREIVYWNHNVQRLAWLEGGFIICTLAVAAVVRESGLGYELVLGVISLFFALRMSLMVWGIARSYKQAKTI